MWWRQGWSLTSTRAQQWSPPVGELQSSSHSISPSPTKKNHGFRHTSCMFFHIQSAISKDVSVVSSHAVLNYQQARNTNEHFLVHSFTSNKVKCKAGFGPSNLQ